LGRDLHGTLLQSELMPLVLTTLSQILLDRVEFADPGQGRFHAGRVQSPALDVLPPRMCPTAHFDDPPSDSK